MTMNDACPASSGVHVVQLYFQHIILVVKTKEFSALLNDQTFYRHRHNYYSVTVVYNKLCCYYVLLIVL